MNVGMRLSEVAAEMPDAMAVAVPGKRPATGVRPYHQVSFAQLEEDSNKLAAGFQAMGIPVGSRLVLAVPPSIEFVTLVFAMLKAGMVMVLVDPGMGRRNLLRCLEEVQPAGFVGIPLVQAVRSVFRRRFSQARHNVTVGRRWFWGGVTLKQLLRQTDRSFVPVKTGPEDPAAIIFTTGSTGPPKGVLYQHQNFNNQVDQIRDFYGIEAGEIDLPGFPLFALFNSVMGVSTVIPDMDPTRPADVDPRNIIEPINQWEITQAFGSPALWNTVGQYCEQTDEKMPTLKRVLSAGAPVPEHVLRRLQQAIHPEGDIYTPYGATEALPVASTSATEVLQETITRSREGAGTCVGSRFSQIQWKVIRIEDGPLAEMAEVDPLPAGEIGELMVRGPVVTKEYVTNTAANALHKVNDQGETWHRMGDVGYLDQADRFWFCGRKTHRIRTASGTMFTVPCETVFNQHPSIYRSALVGMGPVGQQRPVMIVELWPNKKPADDQEQRQLVQELLVLAGNHHLTEAVQEVLIHPSLPVDIRHNSKIFREQLA
ncbi:MAG: fatty acid CoA ligase family protein, partial [Planctomycetota bacterium]|nr:fatty acid CoA ligase family protein [Planctomycetota bacterium]